MGLWWLHTTCLLAATAAALTDSTPFNQVAILMTHNSATGEQTTSGDVDTQTETLVQQLDCGARAFDYRPYSRFSDGKLIAHHTIPINVPMSDSIRSVTNWLQKSSNHNELVIFYVNDFDGAGSESEIADKAETLLRESNIHTIRDCAELQGLTMGEAKNLSKLDGGGHLLAVFAPCVDAQYDKNVECYIGVESCCYSDGPMQVFDDYMKSKTGFKDNYVSSGRLWIAQAHWQYNDLWDLLLSPSIVQDEECTDLNNYVASKVDDGEYESLNFVQVDNVCNNGNVLASALDRFNAPAPSTTTTTRTTTTTTPSPSRKRCFSGLSTVNIKGKGLLPISQVEIGDFVQSNEAGQYSRVYAHGHRQRSVRSDFLQLHTPSTILELTPNHMVFVTTKALPIPASQLKEGDYLMGSTLGNDEKKSYQVVKITQAESSGYYAPLTEDGTIVVNGIVASVFPALSEESSHFVPFATMNFFHFHFVSQVMTAPLRAVCSKVSSNLCGIAFHNEEGMHVAVDVLVFLDSLGPVARVILFPPLFAFSLLFYLLETAAACTVLVGIALQMCAGKKMLWFKLK